MALRPAILSLAALALLVSTAQAQIRPVAPPAQPLRIQPAPRAAAVAATPVTPAPILITPAAEQRLNAAQSHFGPVSRALIAREGGRIAAGGEASETLLRQRIDQAGLGDLSTADIDALIQSILFQAARDAQDELRDQIEAMKATNAQKAARRAFEKAQRESVASAKLIPQPAYTLGRAGAPPLQSEFDKLKAEKDTLSDLSEDEQIKLQQLTDRIKNVMETLSNLMKKVSDTQSTIIKNMK